MTTTKTRIIQFPDISSRLLSDDQIDYMGPFVDIICKYLSWNDPKVYHFHGGGKLNDIDSVTAFKNGDKGRSIYIKRESPSKFRVSRVPSSFILREFYKSLPKLLEDRFKLTSDNPQNYLSDGI